MNSVANVALAAVKSSAELSSPSEVTAGRKKATRISELLLEGAAKDKLVGLGADAVPPPSMEASASGGASSSVYPGGSGSLHSSSGAKSGVSKWRKATKSVAVTKALAGRPKALGGARPSAAPVVPKEQDEKKLISTPEGAGGLKRLRASLGALSQHLVLKPETKWYHVWWFYYAVAIAVISCWLEPFAMAFTVDGAGAAMRGTSWISVVEYFIIVTFVLDFVLKFMVAYYDSETGMLVTTQPKMAFAYFKSFKFFLDLLGCFPYDQIITAICSVSGASTTLKQSLDWLKLMSLTRAYRVFDLFQVLDYHMIVSQGTLMLLRNYTYVIFTAHWAACVFYHLATQEGFRGDESWVGRNAEAFVGRPVYEQYILSLYFSVTVFTAMGDARLFPFTIPELAIMIVYLFFNIFLAAYIIGTVTIMMVQADEHSKSFRDSVSHLAEYSRENELPERLHKAMKEHLEVHFDSAQSADDKVLQIYPTAIRRRALRHLYLQPVKNCYLFRGCKQRFLDAILTVAHVELFLPGVEIITEGDNVTELLIVVVGEVNVGTAGARPGAGGAASNVYGTMTASAVGSEMISTSRLSIDQSFSKSFQSVGEQSIAGDTDGASVNGDAAVTSPVSPGGVTVGVVAPPKIARGSITMKGSSDALAEAAFFTDSASYETVVGTTPVRVLSLPKSAWELLVQQFPQQARVVLENLQKAAESAVEENLKTAAARSQLTASQLHVALSLVTGSGAFADSTDPILLAQTRDALTHQQVEMITRLDDIRSVVSAHVRKVDEMRTFEFLNTAATGDVDSLRTMLSQGISANTADYDGRTGLMLAAAQGHDDTVKLLLNCGADKDKLDAFGISALAEAAKNAHDSTIELLLSYGATLGAGGLAVATDMCTAVYQNDLVKLRRLLHAGAPPDACDYDKRSPMHIAGAEGNLEAVKLLVEEGGADPNFQDRWGNTALDEARRVGATAVITYLESRQNRDAGLNAEKKRQQVSHEFMSWCTQGEVQKLRQAGGYNYGDEAGCAFSGLLVAATKGHKDVVEVLLEGIPAEVARQHAHVAMLEAARMGQPETVAAFRAAGITLPDSRTVSLRYLAAEMRNAAQQGNGAVVEALLAAGVPGRLSADAGEGGAPLHLAVEHSHLGVVRRLLEHGGTILDLTTPDGLGRTPLSLAKQILSKRPNDPRAQAVHDFLAWATQLAQSGAATSQSQLAAAALERWGAIGTHHESQAQGPAVLALAAEPDGVALVGAASAAPGFWDKGPLSPMLAGAGRTTGAPSPLRAPAEVGPPSAVRRESALVSTPAGFPASSAAAAASSTVPNAPARTTSVDSNRSGHQTPAAPAPPGLEAESSSAAAVAEAWDNLPGTPGNSTPGGLRVAQSIKQLEASGSATDAAMMYTATIMHSSALLNEPPPPISTAAAIATGAPVGSISRRASLGAIAATGPNSPMASASQGPASPFATPASPSAAAGRMGMAPAAGPPLQLPLQNSVGPGGLTAYAAVGPMGLASPAAARTASAASLAVTSPVQRHKGESGTGMVVGAGGLGSPAPGGAPGVRLSGVVGSTGGLGSPSVQRPGSRNAAARLFGEVVMAGLTPPETAALAAAPGSNSGSQSAIRTLNSPVINNGRPQSPTVPPWRRSSVVVPVPEDDDLDHYMGNLASAAPTPTGAAASIGSKSSETGEGGAGALPRTGSRLGLSSQQRSQGGRSVGRGALEVGRIGSGGLSSPATLRPQDGDPRSPHLSSYPQ